jgi:hypothetical protein
LGGQTLEERTRPGELRDQIGRAVVVGCGHASVLRTGERRRIG